jgi:hypothetical protein
MAFPSPLPKRQVGTLAAVGIGVMHPRPAISNQVVADYSGAIGTHCGRVKSDLVSR